MVTKHELKNTLYNELITVCTDSVNTLSSFSVDNIDEDTSSSSQQSASQTVDIDDHVGTLNNYDQSGPLPFFGFEVFGQPLNRGWDGNVHVDDVVYESDEISHVTYHVDTQYTVEMVIVTDGDEVLKDQCYTVLRDHFDKYTAVDKRSIHADVSRLRDGGFSDESRPSDNVIGDRQQYTIRGSRYFRVDDLVPVRNISLSLHNLEDESYVYDSTKITA